MEFKFENHEEPISPEELERIIESDQGSNIETANFEDPTRNADLGELREAIKLARENSLEDLERAA